MKRRARRNPDILGDVILAGGVVAIAAIGIPALTKSLSNVQINLPGLPQITFPGLPSPAATVRNTLVGDPNVILTNAIDGWFNNAGGIFGIGAYDPTSYASMIQGVNRIALMPVAFPSSPPDYFLQKSADWAQAHQSSTPYGSGYHG